PIPAPESWMARTERQMPQMGGGTEVFVPSAAPPPERCTTLPMAPVGPVTAPSPQRRAPPATVPMSLAELALPDERRSTGIPVESGGPRGSSAAAMTSRRRLALMMAAGAVVFGAG